MVDFRFDIRPLFPQPIVKVTSTLLPHTFCGDRRQALDATSKMSEIIDRLGQLSAASQKLAIPITTGQRLRQSDNQTIYILADTEIEPRGVAVGLLKIGKKDLYLFDETGQTRKIESAPCILDFYIHESRQRAGLGKELFETMLSEENWKPVKCSIDRPSEKLLAFIQKNYGLDRTIPQANNFVLFEGFFDNSNVGKNDAKQQNGLHITNSINTQLFGAVHFGDENRRQRSRQPDIAAQVTQVAPAGRYGARRPVCSMAQIIHQVGEPDKQEISAHSFMADAEIASLSNELVNLKTAGPTFDKALVDNTDAFSTTSVMGDNDDEEFVVDAGSETEVDETEINVEQQNNVNSNTSGDKRRTSVTKPLDNIIGMKKPSTFHLSKQHTGMKNISFGVGMAVTPSNKMEFDQESREEFGVVKINRPIGKIKSPPPTDTDVMSTVSSTGEGLTDQGYYDLKFYHNKLW